MDVVTDNWEIHVRNGRTRVFSRGTGRTICWLSGCGKRSQRDAYTISAVPSLFRLVHRLNNGEWSACNTGNCGTCDRCAVRQCAAAIAKAKAEQ